MKKILLGILTFLPTNLFAHSPNVTVERYIGQTADQIKMLATLQARSGAFTTVLYTCDQVAGIPLIIVLTPDGRYVNGKYDGTANEYIEELDSNMHAAEEEFANKGKELPRIHVIVSHEEQDKFCEVAKKRYNPSSYKI